MSEQRWITWLHFRPWENAAAEDLKPKMALKYGLTKVRMRQVSTGCVIEVTKELWDELKGE